MRKMKKVVLGMTVMSMMMSMAAPMGMPISPLGVTTVSADVRAQGRCGDNVDYQYDYSTETLTLVGKGATWDNYPIKISAGDVKHIVVDKGVTTVGTSIFSKLYDVEDVKLADTVTTIKTKAFNYISDTIEIPASVTKVETKAFDKAKNIIFKGDVIGYEIGAFGISEDNADGWDEENIAEVSLNGAADDLGKALYGADAGAITMTKENKKCRIENGCLTTADGKVLYYCINSSGKIAIPDSVESISPLAFSFVYLDEVKFGKNLKNVGDFAFANGAIKKLKVNKKLAKIGVKAFYDINIKNITFSGKVKMDVAAFDHHTKIENAKKFKYSQTTLDTANIAKKKVTVKFAKVTGAKGYEIVIKRGKKTFKYTTTKNSFTKTAPSKLTKNYEVEKTYSMENDEYLQKIKGAATVKVRPYKMVKKSKKSKKMKKSYGMWSAEMVISMS